MAVPNDSFQIATKTPNWRSLDLFILECGGGRRLYQCHESNKIFLFKLPDSSLIPEFLQVKSRERCAVARLSPSLERRLDHSLPGRYMLPLGRIARPQSFGSCYTGQNSSRQGQIHHILVLNAD
jgi:hypothetical protein